MENNRKGWYSCHILFGIALILTGVFVIADSLRMSIPLLEKGQATVLDMPGLSPILCSLLLIVGAAVVIVSSWRRGGTLSFFFTPALIKALTGREARTAYKVFVLLSCYVFILFPYVTYWLATFLFLIVFMWAFRVFSWKSALVSLGTALSIWYIFGHLFGINLPK